MITTISLFNMHHHTELLFLCVAFFFFIAGTHTEKCVSGGHNLGWNRCSLIIFEMRKKEGKWVFSDSLPGALMIHPNHSAICLNEFMSPHAPPGCTLFPNSVNDTLPFQLRKPEIWQLSLIPLCSLSLWLLMISPSKFLWDHSTPPMTAIILFTAILPTLLR